MNDQYILLISLIALLGVFIWGKFRYDAVSSTALIILVIIGIIPAGNAFDGFSHPAVLTVALVLVISTGLKNSGMTGLVNKLVGVRKFTEFQFLITLMVVAANLSSFINNI